MYGKKESNSPYIYCPTVATVKCEGWNNLMVWGCMGWNNMGMLIEIKEKMNPNHYC